MERHGEVGRGRRKWGREEGREGGEGIEKGEGKEEERWSGGVEGERISMLTILLVTMYTRVLHNQTCTFGTFPKDHC